MFSAFASAAAAAASLISPTPAPVPDIKTKAALDAADAAIPRNYHLQPAKPVKIIRFLVFGCQGNAKEAQKYNARLMNQLVQESKTTDSPILFAIGAGDNAYDEGVKSPADPIFQTHFYDIYGNKIDVPFLAAIPFLMALGNHDEGLYVVGEYTDKVAEVGLKEPRVKGIPLGMNQVAHTYYGDTTERIRLYSQDTLPLDRLPLWNMPSRYYSVILNSLQIFVIDSNTYASEYLRNKYQAWWLKTNVDEAIAAGRTVMLVLHHPFFTPGKRAYNSDISLYLKPDEIEAYKNIFPSIFFDKDRQPLKPPYNLLLWKIFMRQAIYCRCIFAAHDHSLSYFNNHLISTHDGEKLCQVVSAGGGGNLQQRRNFNLQEAMGCFLKKHGVVEVAFDPAMPDDVRFTFIASDDLGRIENKIEFSSKGPAPIQRFSIHHTDDEITRIKRFLLIVKSAIDEYCEWLGTKQNDYAGTFFSKNFSHRDEGIDRVHELWAYIYDIRTCSLNFADIIRGVECIVSKRLTQPSGHSLITILNNHIMKYYSVTIDTLSRQVQPPPSINIASP